MAEQTATQPPLLASLRARGLIAQLTHDALLNERLEAGPMTFYVGYDPTADSLHAGHLVTLMAARWLCERGHRCLLLVGGGTARIGDPTGKSEARPVLDDAKIAQHAQCIHEQMQRLMPAGADVLVVNNASWLDGVSLLSFLRDTAPHFSVARMLSAETYKARVGAGLSLLEFCYQPLQSLDFSVLCKSHDCRLQLGGDDQWSNILGGVELCRRRAQGQTFGLTVPLIATANGAKMGKSQGGAVWLDPQKTSPSQFYQYWVNTADDDLLRFLQLFTTLSLQDIQDVKARPSAELNAAKNVLAFEVTAWVHGLEAARSAHLAALAAFGGRTLPPDLLAESQVPRVAEVSASDMPSCELGDGESIDIVGLLVRLGWAKSKNEARRLVTQGAIVAQDERVTEPLWSLAAETLPEAGIVIRAGKKRVVRVCRAR